MIINGDLESAQLECFTTGTLPPATLIGRLIYNTTTSRLLHSNGVVWVEVALIGGSSSHQFSVANATLPEHSVNKSQLETRALLGGIDSQVFLIAASTDGSHALRRDQAIGVDQTYQAPIRAINTVYKNTSGKPIFISIGIRHGVNGGATYIAAGGDDGVFNGSVASFANFGANTGAPLSTIIPNNVNYYLTTSVVGVIISAWVELRL